MKTHHLKLKEKLTGKIYYMPTDLEVYSGVLSITKTPNEILSIFKSSLPEYEVIGECYKNPTTPDKQ